MLSSFPHYYYKLFRNFAGIVSIIALSGNYNLFKCLKIVMQNTVILLAASSCQSFQ